MFIVKENDDSLLEYTQKIFLGQTNLTRVS